MHYKFGESFHLSERKRLINSCAAGLLFFSFFFFFPFKAKESTEQKESSDDKKEENGTSQQEEENVNQNATETTGIIMLSRSKTKNVWVLNPCIYKLLQNS